MRSTKSRVAISSLTPTNPEHAGVASDVGSPDGLTRALQRISLANSIISHQVRVVLGGLEERLAGERKDLAVADRHHAGRMRRAGDQRHFAGRFAGTDHAEKLRLLTLFVTAEMAANRPGADKEELVGLLAGLAQNLAAGQQEPKAHAIGHRVVLSNSRVRAVSATVCGSMGTG